MAFYGGGTVQGALRLQGRSSPGLSAAGEGRIYFDQATNKFVVSENGGAYVDLVAGAESLAQTLAVGNTTGGNDIVVSNGQIITAEANLSLVAGDAEVAVLVGGTSTGATAGGDAWLYGGDATGSGNGGDVEITGGSSVDGTAGTILIGNDSTYTSAIYVGALLGEGTVANLEIENGGNVTLQTFSDLFLSASNTMSASCTTFNLSGNGQTPSYAFTIGSNGEGSVTIGDGAVGTVFTVNMETVNIPQINGSTTAIYLNQTPDPDPSYPAGMWVLAPVGEAIYLGAGTILVEGDGTNNRIRGKFGATGSGAAGEQLWLTGGAGDGAAAGGLLRLEGGAGGANGNGAAVNIAAGAGGSSSGDGGSISISAGSTTAGEGGGVSITGGGGTGGFDGGDISITGGANGGGAAEPGAVVITGGSSGSGGFSGGTLSLLGGNNTSAGPGGSVTLRGGTGSTGGQTLVTGGHGNATGAGGALNLYSGNGGSTSGNSGAVNLDVGSVVSGTAGTISVGTTRASALTIGRSGVTTTVAGVADMTGAVGLGAVTSVSGNTTLDATNAIVLVDASGGPVTITLPAAAGSTRRHYTIKKVDSSANAVTIDGDGAETIDGATTQSLAVQYDALQVVSNGTAWFVV